MTTRRSVLAGAALAPLAVGCATLRPLLTRHRDGTLLFVPPFVDVTPEMRVGFLLTTVVQEAIYSRAPRRFVVVFDDAALAVDGTVVAVDDRPAAVSDGALDVWVRARATLVDKRGVVRHDTGLVEKAGRFQPDPSSATETAARRARALQVAVVTVGGALADLLLEMP